MSLNFLNKLRFVWDYYFFGIGFLRFLELGFYGVKSRYSSVNGGDICVYR